MLNLYTQNDYLRKDTVIFPAFILRRIMWYQSKFEIMIGTSGEMPTAQHAYWHTIYNVKMLSNSKVIQNTIYTTIELVVYSYWFLLKLTFIVVESRSAPPIKLNRFRSAKQSSLR